MKGLLILLGCVAGLIIIMRLFKKPIRRWMVQLSNSMFFNSLKQAIKQADKDKDKTDRKNIVVFNKASNEFEPIQKRQLKAASRLSKSRNNAAQTAYRKKHPPKKRFAEFSNDRIQHIEKKSLYVTR